MKALSALLFASLILLAWLAGCASRPPMPPADLLFHDELFDAPSVSVDPDSPLAVSPAMMRSYIATHMASRLHTQDRRRVLLDALYHRGELRLEYDASMTRTASEAFDARMGNCLALVMMTAAFAKEIGVPVRFQSVIGAPEWDRSSDMYIGVGHVNVALDDRASQALNSHSLTESMTVDFLPPADVQGLRTRVVAERTVIAMYLNNRAVESLAAGLANDAYWWARAALQQDPELLGAYVTLGVVYRNRHHLELADQALLRVGEREPDNLYALSNRVVVLRELGRPAEADALAQRLDRLDPHPPFSYFQEGMTAYRERRFDAARALFNKEIDRAPYQHEFEFWLASTYAELHDMPHAREHLARAMEVSTTRKDHDLYRAKLDRLKALGLN